MECQVWKEKEIIKAVCHLKLTVICPLTSYCNSARVKAVKLSHEQKVKIARKMRTLKELKEKVSIFQTEAWEKRREARMRREERKRKK